jgi:hypothetical protein
MQKLRIWTGRFRQRCPKHADSTGLRLSYPALKSGGNVRRFFFGLHEVSNKKKWLHIGKQKYGTGRATSAFRV